jgi:hypothetical protein
MIPYMKVNKIIALFFVFSLIPLVPASAEEEHGGWAVVDENGIVQNITVCTESVCGEGGEWGGVLPGTNWKLVKQKNNANEGGHWGTYDFENKTFYVDRSCSDCEPWENLETPGIIRNGILTEPIFKAYVELSNQDEINNVTQASNLVAYTMSYHLATSNKKKVKLNKNILKFKKNSLNTKVCVVKNNSILIKKSGICRLNIEGKKNNKIIKVRVFK